MRRDRTLDRALKSLENVSLARVSGRLVRVSGMLLECTGCNIATGQRCQIEQANGQLLDAEVVGFNRDLTWLMAFKPPLGLKSGARVFPSRKHSELRIGPAWLGRVFNGLGEVIDGKAPPGGDALLPLIPPALHPLQRKPVSEALDVGVSAINGLLTIGKGQRIGLMAGSGVGKSMLLGMMTRGTTAQVVVVGLTGERGREVQEFIEHVLQAQGMAKAVVIAAPADESPLMRLRATELCHAIAAWFRDAGQDVLLLVDSLTRYAMAQREIALSLGEPPANKGYPPSAFAMLPRLVETAGNSDGCGTMTAIYSVLTEGDDQQDPIADCARAVLDGHIVLSRELAEAGHYPPIDIGQSISRCMQQITTRPQQQAAQRLKRWQADYAAIKPLISLGGYVPGADLAVDEALRQQPAIAHFLCQDAGQPVSLSQAQQQLHQLAQRDEA
ncbi:FliI/YscN family ATPase [Pantoea sp. A4]|uniref:FliI/YscN family ATPase n=1 Tax=Pantoea sp. A4 TaxID=1225184 RepID=UPI000474496F|nr:FliI/YscN family ATPase [Pantoea sp. A4]